MTRAGAANLAFGKTDGLLGNLQTADTYYEPGKDPELDEDPELDRDLEQIRMPDEVFHDESVEGNIEGAFGISVIPESSRIDDLHDVLYNNASGSGDLLTPGEPATSRWYVGIDYIAGTAERVLKGVIPLSVDVEYSQGDSTRYSITFGYADEEYNTSITPSSVNEATGETVQFHSTELSLDGTVQSKEQSFTLSIADMSAFHYGSDPVAEGATVANPTASLDVTTIITEDNQLDLAYGGSGQTTTSSRMTAVDGTITLSDSSGAIATYNLSSMKTENHTWQNLINADDDAAENYTMQVNGVSLA